MERIGTAKETIVKTNMEENLFVQGEDKEDGWQGTITVYFDENGIVFDTGCGMG